MAKSTLLEIVQAILNEMDSDAVNSIDDTVESQQVALIVKGCFHELTSNKNWAHMKKVISLEHSGDITKPNYLKIPEGLHELLFFKYEKQKLGDNKVLQEDVLYRDPWEFLQILSHRDSSLPNITTIIDNNGTKLLIRNDTAPTYWTSFDDSSIVTDSYDKQVDDTLRKSKTQCHAVMSPVWHHTDSSIPDLPDDAFSLLIEESKSTAFFTLKQEANQKAEQKAKRQKTWLSRKDWKAHGGITYQNYGRRGRI